MHLKDHLPSFRVGPQMHNRIAALLTCHNRKATTLGCLDRLFGQILLNEVELDVFLVDNGSTDGTADAVTRCFPQVCLLRGDPSLFWAGGMRWAFGEAIKEDYDFYLWVNDDTQMNPDAVAHLLATYKGITHKSSNKVIVVGSTRDPVTGEHTYGGAVRCSRYHPLKYRLVEPGDEPKACDTMNGNFVLIPRAVVKEVCNIRLDFRHAIGDFDYGLRARQRGCTIWIAPGYIGTCPRNSFRGTFLDKTLSLGTRWQKMLSIKGLPFNDYRAFARLHGGPFWPIFWLLPYVRLVLTSSLTTFRS
jgi:GT2 family glycosyltransferase